MLSRLRGQSFRAQPFVYPLIPELSCLLNCMHRAIVAAARPTDQVSLPLSSAAELSERCCVVLQLFENNGNPRAALQALVKKPPPLTIEKKWTEDQVVRARRKLLATAALV